jgi:hypothetical protein
MSSRSKAGQCGSPVGHVGRKAPAAKVPEPLGVLTARLCTAIEILTREIAAAYARLVRHAEIDPIVRRLTIVPFESR